MTKAILHAGMHKTGSTYLQNTLHANRELLLDEGLLYPASGLHLDSPQAGYRHLGLRRSLQQEGPDCFAMRRLREEVAASTCDTVVISYEGFFTPDTDVSQLREALDDFDVTVLLFLRHPVDYVESKYREWVRLLNHAGEIEQFLSLQWPFLDVLARADEWEQQFGSDRMIVRSYDQLREPSDIVHQLLSLAERPDLVLEPAADSNPGAGNEYTLAKLLANRMRLSGTIVNPQTVAAMEIDYGSNGGRLLSDAAVEQIERDAGPTFAALLERAGQDPHLTSRWATTPSDTRFFDHSVRESVVQQLDEARERSIVESELRARDRTEAQAEGRRNRRNLDKATSELERVKQKSQRLDARLGETKDRLGETKDRLASARAAEQETATRLSDAESRLQETEVRLVRTSERLDTIQARLQRTSAERTELRRRAELLRVWRPRNWPEYVAIAWTRLRTSLRKRATADN